MWEGKYDEKLNQLYDEYYERFGCLPDTYEEIYYDDMSYDEFVGYINQALEKNVEIDEVIE